MLTDISCHVTTVVVTRGNRITLTKDVRAKLGIQEGDLVTINTIGRAALITKRDPTVWRRTRDFLPPHFETARRGPARAEGIKSPDG